MSGVYILSVLAIISFVSVTAYFETCSSGSQCEAKYVCVATRCRCPVNQFHENNTCKDKKLYDKACVNELQCRLDLGLVCSLQKCSCGAPGSGGTWSAGKCEGDHTCGRTVTDYAFDCWMFAEEFFKKTPDLSGFSELMQFANDTCGQHVGGVIECVGNVYAGCPSDLPRVQKSSMYANYTKLKNWRGSHCSSSMFEAFTDSFDCVKQAVAAASFQTCMRKAPGPDVQTGLYPCSINSAIKSCLDSAVGTTCGQDAADAAASAVKLLELKTVDGCPTKPGPTGRAAAIQAVCLLLYLSQFIYLLV